jgi:ketosteroid isomerase-like protein
MNQQPQRVDPAELPEAITRYLDAHRVHDTTTAVNTFAADAVVRDDGHTYIGTAAIEKWLTRSASEYTYTIELTGAHRGDASHYIVTNHLEGDFPGGQVDLHYRFALDGELINGLTIEP